VKYLSVCSGIEAASVAWHPLGWQPLAFSEIEPFPRAVLAHHYPDVPCHGDFTVLRDQPWIEDADILVGGTPCQAFSVAGLRNSLADDRGNLSLEYVRLADAIDNFRLAAGRQPAVIVWENVPGVLSVKDNAFGCFLAALAGDASPYVPPRGKWTDAGVVDGPQRAVAWRILDAQYFGLAQRRRRVFVVASARKGFDPAAVLLEFEGMRRDTPPRREAGQVAPTIPSRSTAGGGLGTDFDCDGGVIKAAWPADIAPTLNASFGEKQGLEDQHIRGGVDCSFPAISQCLNAGGMGRRDWETETFIPTIGCVFDDVAHTLKGEGFDASEDGTGRGTPLVPVISDAVGFYANEGSHGSGQNVEMSPTLKAHPKTSNLAAVAYRTTGNDGVYETGDLVAALTTATDPNSHVLTTPTAYAFQPRIARNGRGDMGDVVNALNAQSGETGKGDAAPCVALSFKPGQSEAAGGTFVTEEFTPTLQAQNNGSTAVPAVMQHMAVRRLTPVECERLQGFPDNYTAIPWRKAAAEDCPDGPRYKALGNSMAVPCMAWIGKRLLVELNA